MPVSFVKIQTLTGEGELPEGSELVEISTYLPKLIPFRCKQGICGTCRVRLISGESYVSSPTPEEIKFLSKLGFVPGEYRLACQLRVYGNLILAPVNDFPRRRNED